MPGASVVGRWIFLAGLALMLIGLGVWLAGRLGLPLGRLPGDIRIQRGGFTLYLPLATSLLLSLGLSLLVNLLARLWRR